MTCCSNSVLEMFSDGRTVGTSVLRRLKQACISSASDADEVVDAGLEMRPPEALEMPWRAAKEPKCAEAAAEGVATMVLAFIFAEVVVLLGER